MLNNSERKILKEIQAAFPINPRPWKILAERLGMSEKNLIYSLRGLKKKGVVRYIGGIFDPAKLGLSSTLAAIKAPRRKISRIVSIINSYPQVTHNYLREGDYNLWFTLTAFSGKELGKLLSEIKQRTGIKEILDFRTRKKFKIKTVFDL